MGNVRDDFAARGVHDPLCSHALVAAGGSGEKIALVSLDIACITREQAAMMREWIGKRCGISAGNILIHATHTHAGPATMSMYTWPKADDDQIEEFLKKACAAVVLADENMREGNLSIGYSREDRISFNRRLKCKDGKTHMNWESHDSGFVVKALGPVDPQVIAVSVEQEGKPEAAIVNFALHPAVLDYGNWLYSADYPGYLAEATARIQGDKGFTTLFFNGCCGNINHIDCSDPMAPRRGYQAAQRIGYMLAAAAKQALDASVPLSGDELRVSRRKVVLERFKIGEKRHKWARDVLDEMKTNPSGQESDGLPAELTAPVWIEMYERQDRDDEVEVMVIRIGDLGIVGFPGEMFTEFGLQIKERSPANHTIVCELANGCVGYLPTAESYVQGGYEATPGATAYAKGCGERLAASALDQLKELFC